MVKPVVNSTGTREFNSAGAGVINCGGQGGCLCFYDANDPSEIAKYNLRILGTHFGTTLGLPIGSRRNPLRTQYRDSKDILWE